jgi:tryptophan 2,3-dioxygenase
MVQPYYLVLFKYKKMAAPIYYKNYLALPTILQAQNPQSNHAAHDEMLFIITHQTYELWFKQIIYELDSVLQIMGQGAINDNSPAMQTVVHRLNRCVTIFETLVKQIDVMETMTPMEFLEFRDLLRPASGFQSYQFKIIEAKLGLKMEQRYGQNYYTSQLQTDDLAVLKNTENQTTILQLLNSWLERMPFNNTEADWAAYANTYKANLLPAENSNAELFDAVFFTGQPNNSLSPKASRAALFILSYRGYPMLEQPYLLLAALLEIDNQLAQWRNRHMQMVRRTIGARVGTGGSTGAAYLKGAIDTHFIFKDIAMLTSFLLSRANLPALSKEVTEKLGFL